MANTTLTLLAAGSLRSASCRWWRTFGSTLAWRSMRSLALPACCASGSKPGRRARFCFRQRGAPAGAAAGGSGAGMPGFASNQLMLTARRSPDNDGSTGWRCSARPPAVGDLHAGLRSVGRLYRSCSPELRHAIRVGQRDGRAGAAAGRRQRLTERAAGRDSRRVALFARIWRICLSAMRTMAPRWPPATICVP